MAKSKVSVGLGRHVVKIIHCAIWGKCYWGGQESAKIVFSEIGREMSEMTFRKTNGMEHAIAENEALTLINSFRPVPDQKTPHKSGNSGNPNLIPAA